MCAPSAWFYILNKLCGMFELPFKDSKCYSIYFDQPYKPLLE